MERIPIKSRVSCSNALRSWGVEEKDPFFSESVSGIARTMEMASSVGEINFKLCDHYSDRHLRGRDQWGRGGTCQY